MAMFLLSGTGCAPSRPVAKTYGLVHRETTGITHYLVRDGKEVSIRFAGDSDPRALASLRALKWNVLYPNSAGDRIFVTGVIGEEQKHTPSGPGYAVSQAYHAFRLTGWFIRTPFKRIDWKDGIPAPGDDMEIQTRDHLDATDFEDYPGKPSLRIRELERP